MVSFRRMIRCLVAAAVWFVLAGTGAAFAEDVMASSRVTTAVVVRARASAQSAALDQLAPGDRLPFVNAVPRWNRVRLPDGRIGYISKTWSVVVASLAPQPPSNPSPTTVSFTLHVVDVGTGLALIVRGPDFTLVYDGGSNDDLARGAGNRLLAYMHHALPDVADIDELVLSHPHRDHVELLADLFGAYRVHEVWDSGRNNPICGYRLFLEAIRDEQGVIYHDASGDGGQHSASFAAQSCYGQSLPSETVSFPRGRRIDKSPIPLGAHADMVILHADGSNTPNVNDNSLVVRLDLGAARVLLMGDAEAGGRHDPSQTPDPQSVEGQLLSCCAADLHADLMVVGHHGSMTSSRDATLDAVGAHTFVVSSGPTKYGSVTLPDHQVVEDLTRRGAVWLTNVSDATCPSNAAKIGPDADGRAGGCDNIEITITSDGHISAAYNRDHD